jgi:integrase
MATSPSAATSTPARDPSPWQWPIDLTRYDRTPTLTAAERTALATLGWDLRRGRYHHPQPSAWAAIERLAQPLEEARRSLFIPADPYHQRCSRDALAIILHACATTQQAFWAWTSATWMEIFGKDHRAFQRSHPGWSDSTVRPYAVAIAYLLDCFAAFEALGPFSRIALARRVFGPQLVQQAVDPVMATLRGWGYQSARHTENIPGAVGTLLLCNRSPYLAELSASLIERCKRQEAVCPRKGYAFYGVHRAIAALGFVAPPKPPSGSSVLPVAGVDAIWQDWVERWAATSTLTAKVRINFRTILLKAGRWLAQQHPSVREPGQWTRELCAAYLAQVQRLHVGDFTQHRAPLAKRLGQPLAAKTKRGYIVAVRTFFYDCQEWEWIPRRFDPARALATPRSILALTGPSPRVIADDIWAKLLWAGLNLEASDLPANAGAQCYPLELVRALALVWLFAGLRSDEIARLRVGCMRSQRDEVSVPGHPDERIAKGAVCLLDIPPHKTGSAYTKPVDPLVGQAVAAWEAIRPEQPPLLDQRTGELVRFLFCYRARRVAKTYLNHALIPALCRKAGVPLQDARGRITSHRARATIASQLYNAKEPMTLFELQAWLGHRSAETTQYYARITPTTLAKAYTDAGYFARNVRTVEVLIDRDAVAQSAAASGAPWQYFDLGHGYCTYTFFEQCPHRMACARCDFYLPKASTEVQLLEAKDHLQRMLAAIPLTEEERAAVEDGAVALGRLVERLADAPTPAGQTPRQLAQRASLSGTPQSAHDRSDDHTV